MFLELLSWFVDVDRSVCGVHVEIGFIVGHTSSLILFVLSCQFYHLSEYLCIPDRLIPRSIISLEEAKPTKT